MRTYASISPLFWTRGSGKRLRGDASAQVVALYLMTSPSTSMVGIFHMALPTLCHETGLSAEEATKGLRRCSEEQIAFWDEAEELVFVPALAKHQIGENLKPKDHKVKGVARALAPFKGHKFYDLFMDRYADAYSISSDVEQAPPEPLPRDDVPVLSCPAPGLDLRAGSTHESGSPGACDLQTRATIWVEDVTKASLAAPHPEKWPELLRLVALVAEVFGGPPQAPRTSGDPRVVAVLKLWAEGRTMPELEQAIRGAGLDSHYRGNPQFQTLQTILKDSATVDKFIRLLTVPAVLRPVPARSKGALQPNHGKTGMENVKRI